MATTTTPEEKLQLRPGWKTTEFWFSIVGAVAPWALEAAPPTVKAVITAGAAAVYAIARGLAKLGIR